MALTKLQERKYPVEDEDKILRDYLAIDRTRLANQRTLLSFFRTGLYMFVTALAVIKVEVLKELKVVAIIFFVLSALCIVIGVVNYLLVRKKIENHY